MDADIIHIGQKSYYSRLSLHANLWSSWEDETKWDMVLKLKGSVWDMFDSESTHYSCKLPSIHALWQSRCPRRTITCWVVSERSMAWTISFVLAMKPPLFRIPGRDFAKRGNLSISQRNPVSCCILWLRAPRNKMHVERSPLSSVFWKVVLKDEGGSSAWLY